MGFQVRLFISILIFACTVTFQLPAQLSVFQKQMVNLLAKQFDRRPSKGNNPELWLVNSMLEDRKKEVLIYKECLLPWWPQERVEVFLALAKDDPVERLILMQVMAYYEGMKNVKLESYTADWQVQLSPNISRNRDRAAHAITPKQLFEQLRRIETDEFSTFPSNEQIKKEKGQDGKIKLIATLIQKLFELSDRLKVLEKMIVLFDAKIIKQTVLKNLIWHIKKAIKECERNIHLFIIEHQGIDEHIKSYFEFVQREQSITRLVEKESASSFQLEQYISPDDVKEPQLSVDIALEEYINKLCKGSLWVASYKSDDEEDAEQSVSKKSGHVTLDINSSDDENSKVSNLASGKSFSKNSDKQSVYKQPSIGNLATIAEDQKANAEVPVTHRSCSLSARVCKVLTVGTLSLLVVAAVIVGTTAKFKSNKRKIDLLELIDEQEDILIEGSEVVIVNDVDTQLKAHA